MPEVDGTGHATKAVSTLAVSSHNLRAVYTPTGVDTPIAEGKETRYFDGRPFLLETAIHVDYAFISGHRADRAVVMTGLERDAARIHETRGRIDRIGPALEQDGAQNRPAHRSAHRRPRNRRSGVENQSASRGHRVDDVARERDIDQHRMSFEKAGESNLIRMLDGSMMEYLRERPGRIAIAQRGRLPHGHHAFAAGGHDVVAEAGEADVDDLQRILEQRLHRASGCRFASCRASCAAIEAAWMLLSDTIAPADASVRICATRSWGSPSVPQT